MDRRKKTSISGRAIGTRHVSSGRWSAIAAIPAIFLIRAALAQSPVINEFLAAGGDLLDEDRDSSDWIEIRNPGKSPLNLKDWYLTDDPLDLKKWRFPDTPLDSGGFLVVFASGKNRAEPGRELHTSFRLAADGDYLALVRSDGSTVAHAYSPTYPPQHDGISFGLPEGDLAVPLVAPGAAVRFKVPVDGGDAGWQLPAHDDADWTAGATGLGYGSGEGLPPGGDPVDLAAGGVPRQSSEYQGGAFPADLALDGDPGTFTHTAAGVNLPAFWEVDLGSICAIATIVLHNRQACCPSRLRDIAVSILDGPDGKQVFGTELLNPENVLGGGTLDGPELIAVDLVARTGGLVFGRVVRVERTPDPDLSGSGGQGNADEPDVLSLGEVEVLGTRSGYGALIQTDVGAVLRGVNSSLYIRIPFTAAEVPSGSLRLRVRYEDGFAAFLNGVEVARRNAPDPLRWDSAAIATRTGAEALAAEEIDLSAHAGLIAAGANLLAIQALNISPADGGLLILPELVALSAPPAGGLYFRQPTPGLPNTTPGIPGFVADTRFSRDRGFCEEPFDLEISTATEGAEIRYTLNGTAPTAAGGLLYAGPIHIERTTVVRARAFKAGLEPTNVDTQTYIFLADVVRQDVQATRAAGFPATWGSTSPDYGMDPDVIGPKDLFGGIYAETIRDDLLSLPTLSIAMAVDDLFGARGIYTNSQQSGVAWERPASVELIHPDGTPGFQVDCGIRIQGGWFRQHSGTKKHSFRLLFKSEYGPAKLRHPLFGKRASEEFDTITLRAGANDGYAWDAARFTEQYTRDEFGRSLQRASGNAGSHGNFVHLYLDGIYWGLYNPAERPDHSFSATYGGGEKEDWDAIHDGVPTNGDLTAWNAMLRQATAARTSAAEFLKLQGRNLDGSLNPAFPHLLDVDCYIDYLIVNLWGGNWDWPWKNWWAGRDRTAASTGFKFYCWDFENTMGNNRDRSPLTKNALQNDFSGVGQPHVQLQQNLEYRLRFADRIHRLFFGDGLLTPPSLIPRYEEISARVERAIVAESARWGDQHFHPPLTLQEWTQERNWILGSYLPQRSKIVLDQFRAAGLYPAVEAPTFGRPGGRAEAPFSLTIAAPAGTVYYTVDGTDPRLPGGAKAPGALAAEETMLLGPGAEARIHVPVDGSLDLAWTGLDFDDSSWTAAETGIGFDTGTDFDASIATDVEAIFYKKGSSIYLRIPFEIDPALLGDGPESLVLLALEMQYDDGYVAYLNGMKVGSRLAPAAPAWNSRASGTRTDAQALAFESLVVPDARDLLRSDRNVLAIHGLNASTSDGDFLLVPALAAVLSREAIPIVGTTTVKARALVGTSWSALAEATFFMDIPLRISEVMYHAAPPPDGSPYEDGDFEYVEVLNIGPDPVDLTGIRLEGGIEFEFPGDGPAVLPPGGTVVVVENLPAFAYRYRMDRIAVAGEYRGRLDNLGDVIILRGPAGETLLDFEFDDWWYPETDGAGPSLVIADPRQDPARWAEAAGWQPSRFLFGSPGIDESGPLVPEGRRVPGDLNGDARLDLSDAIAILDLLFLGGWPVLPCGDGTFSSEANRLLLDSNGDTAVDLTDAIHVLLYLFVDGPPPVLGDGCVPIRDCPVDVCPP